MKRNLSLTHLILLVISFVTIVVGLVLCLNYYFVSDIDTADIVGNSATIMSLVTMLWYMLAGYKIERDGAFMAPLFSYSACALITVATASAAIHEATPFLTASMCTMIVYPVVIAYNQRRFKACTVLFAIMVVAEVCHGFVIFSMFGPEGVIDGGSITNTMNNVQIFVRSFMTSALALCYAARMGRLKKMM